jgi:hypothetical protein
LLTPCLLLAYPTLLLLHIFTFQPRSTKNLKGNYKHETNQNEHEHEHETNTITHQTWANLIQLSGIFEKFQNVSCSFFGFDLFHSKDDEKKSSSFPSASFQTRLTSSTSTSTCTILTLTLTSTSTPTPTPASPISEFQHSQ